MNKKHFSVCAGKGEAMAVVKGEGRDFCSNVQLNSHILEADEELVRLQRKIYMIYMLEAVVGIQVEVLLINS